MDTKKPQIEICQDVIDMTPIYKALLSRDKKGIYLSAHINVCPVLPDDQKIIHGKTEAGYDFILLKKDEPNKMVGRVLSEVGRIGKKNFPTLNLMRTFRVLSTAKEYTGNSSGPALDGSIIYRLQTMLIGMSQILHVNCPQIVFIPEYDTPGTLNTNENNDVTFLALNPKWNVLYFSMHELRHAWQRKYHPEMFENYISQDECEAKYGEHNLVYPSQIAEFDADVFACACYMYFAIEAPEKFFDKWQQSPLLPAYKKSVEKFLSPYHGIIYWDHLIDYKSIYPDLIT